MRQFKVIDYCTCLYKISEVLSQKNVVVHEDKLTGIGHDPTFVLNSKYSSK
jgi:hypothetical protein